MKSALTTILFVLTALGLQAAKDEKIPHPPKEKEGRWGIYSYTEAKAEAAKKKRPIAFLVADETQKEQSEIQTTNKTFWGMEKDCTMVIVPTRLVAEAKNRCGDAVYAALTSKEMGKDSPRMAVMDQTGEKLLGQMNKDALIAAEEKALKAFARQMEDYNKDPSKAPVVAPAAAAAPAAPAKSGTPAATPAPAVAGPVTIKDAKPENWTNAQGRTIEATLVEVNGDTATLLLANGSKVPIAVSTLAPESQKRVEELKVASAK